jgi:hypothetical protein
VNRILRCFAVILVCCLFVSWQHDPASAFIHHHGASDKPSKSKTKGHGQHLSSEPSRAEGGRHHRGHATAVVQYLGSTHVVSHLTKHHLRHHRQEHELAKHTKTRYAYPLGFFLVSPPSFDQSAFPPELSASIRSAFSQGLADGYPARSLVKAGIVAYHPLRGGIFWRREPVKYVIVHSTETGVPQPAVRVIESWNSMGRRHPGAQYVVDRDGSIFQALDPDLGSVHVNVFKTLPGINNDNSVGIEMCHCGGQEYTEAQVASVIKLVVYLQGHYHVPDGNVVTHRYAQQGDHTDPVNFAWDRFISDKGHLQQAAVNLKVAVLNNEAVNWQTAILPLPEAFLELHRPIQLVPRAVAVPPVASSPLAIPAADTLGGATIYLKLKGDSEANPIGGAALLAQPKNAMPIIPPAYPSRSAAKATLPLRGPIELDPAAVKLLESSADPTAERQKNEHQAGRTTTAPLSPANNMGAPIPTGGP